MKRITIVFESGATQEFEVEEFAIRKNGFGELVGAEWEPIEGKKTPLRINVNNIDGIFYEEIN
ncbi:hypothetical protein [Brevibacillus laterosporus]|uniref:hypothetical protein n=1 Tax=Brevibacillus laterosporus TaxID=1465 RepID=UPI000EB450FD|nr:hypothetical protein [Brevibacillus laterosporus]AYK08874.1 hypothetical protein D8Z77_22390 [Brevibacillus laterosporus]